MKLGIGSLKFVSPNSEKFCGWLVSMWAQYNQKLVVSKWETQGKVMGEGPGNMIFDAQSEGWEVKENAFYTIYTYDPFHPQTIDTGNTPSGQNPFWNTTDNSFMSSPKYQN